MKNFINSKLINNKTFFVENNPKNGVINKQAFINHLSQLTVSETRKLEKLFVDLKNGAPIQLAPLDYTTQDGNVKFTYVNLPFINGGKTSYTVICFDGFDNFRNLLTTHRVDVDLTGLMAEAQLDEPIEVPQVIIELDNKKV